MENSILDHNTAWAICVNIHTKFVKELSSTCTPGFGSRELCDDVLLAHLQLADQQDAHVDRVLCRLLGAINEVPE